MDTSTCEFFPTQKLEDLSLLQWNLLADGLEPNDMRRWGKTDFPGTRGNKIATKIASMDADIVCVQELNRFDELKEILVKSGYDGEYLQKEYGAGSKPDGSAVFWKSSKFSLIDKLAIKKVNGWNQVCLCVLLEYVLSDQIIAVASTHLKAHQGRKEESMREEQTTQFTSMIDNWLNDHRSRLILNLFVGDLNSVISKKDNDWRGKVNNVLVQNGYQSSYHVYTWNEVTNSPFDVNEMNSFCSGGEKGLYDYVYYKAENSNNIVVKHCDALLPVNSYRDFDFPSDHIPLFVRYQFM